MVGYEVHANQKSPMGSATAPTIMRRRRVSWNRPSCGFGANFVLVVNASKAQPQSTPTRMAMKGRAETPGLQCRFSENEIG